MLDQDLHDKLVSRIEEHHPGVFVVEVRLIPGRQRRLVIKADTDSGIDLATCAEVSRDLGRWLDETETFDFAYQLEVTSPGVGSPLRLHRQYQQNIGRNLKVLTQDDREIKGILDAVDDAFIELAELPQKKKRKKKKNKKAAENAPEFPIRISFGDIKEAKVFIA